MKFLRRLLAFAVILAVGVVGFRLYSESEPELPALHVASPNAYDTYARALEVANFRSARESNPTDGDFGGPAMTPEAASETLKLVGTGLSQDFTHPGLEQLYSLEITDLATALSESPGGFNRLYRFVVSVGDGLAAGGDFAGAMKTYADALAFAEQTARGLGGTGRAIANSHHRDLEDRMWYAAGRLDGEESSVAAKQLESLIEGRYTMAEVLRDEGFIAHLQLRGLLRDGMRGRVKESLTATGSNSAVAWWQANTFTRRGVLAALDSYYASYEARALRGWSQRGPAVRWPQNPALGLAKMSVIDPQSGENPTLQAIWVQTLDREARMNMLVTTIALRANWRADTVPRNLDELVPGILASVPQDPFEPSTPIRYMRHASGYRIYSVGPDGQDDAGTPTRDAVVTADTRGDIVAGINVGAAPR